MTKHLTHTALYTAIAVVMHYLESLLPALFPFAPGVKLGLANIVALVALFTLGTGHAYAITVVRCLIGSLMSGNLFSIAYSLTGGLVALTGQVILLKTIFPRVTTVGVSVIGSLLHNCAQLGVASIVVWTNLITYLPLMMLTGVFTGIMIGLTARFTVTALPNKLFLNSRGQADREKLTNENKQQDNKEF